MTSTAPAERVHVQLLGYPLALGAAATQHYEEVLREFNLLVVSGAAGPDSAPARVAALVADLDGRHGRNSEIEVERTECLRRGEVTHDFTLVLERSTVTVATALGGHLDEADVFCRSGQTLAMAPSDDVVAFRRWYLHELVTQLTGGVPTAWSGGPG